jgi:polyisoprenoid-binding protein YceI
VRYRLASDRSRFTVQTFASGLLSFFAHSPTFAVRDFGGELSWGPGTTEGSRLDVIVRADSLELVDSVRPADREEIRARMQREVLQVAEHPEIRFQADEIETAHVATNRYHLRIVGTLLLRGVAPPRQQIEAELLHFDDGARLGGEFLLRLSHYGIRPVTALGGAIQLRDDLRLSFDIVAWREEA